MPDLDQYHVVETTFRKQSFAEYYATLFEFADRLDANVPYNTNRPEHIPSGGKYREHVATMKDLGVGAERGDSLLREQRQAVRNLSELDMDASVSYIRTIAISKRDPSMLHTLSLPFKEMPKYHKTTTKQQTEVHLTPKHQKDVPGGVILEGTHPRGNGPYLVNICKGEPVSEESWYNPGGHYRNCSRIVINGLESANRYYFRIRTDGPEGPGPWSQVVSIIVL